MISRIRTVMIATVITRFVAILSDPSVTCHSILHSIEGRNTYGPSPSTSSRSYPHSLHSPALSSAYAVSSPSAPADLPASPAQCSPSRSLSAGSPLIDANFCQGALFQREVVVVALVARPHQGCLNRDYRNRVSGRWIGSGVFVSRRRCQIRSFGSVG